MFTVSGNVPIDPRTVSFQPPFTFMVRIIRPRGSNSTQGQSADQCTA
jgi:hypothetical protein